MKGLFSRSQPDADFQACEWFARLLDEDIEPKDVVAWGHWLEADDRNREAYERVEEAWRQMQAVKVSAPTTREIAEDRYRPEFAVAHWRRHSHARLRLVSVVAFAAILIGAGVSFAILWRATLTTAPRQFATERARYLEAHLQDGSRVELGAMTTLQVAYGAQRRDASLVQGEALFHVAHDRSRPFVVHTPLGAVTAVGTAFDIDIEAAAVTLTVTEGIVSVNPDVPVGATREASGQASTIRVRAGQRLRMERTGGRLILAMGEGGNGAAWTDGRLEYRDVSLKSVVDDVNRYTTRPIIVADSGLANLRYTGTVQLDSADTWVLGLSAAFPITVELDDNGQFVLRPRSKASVSMDDRASRRPAWG